MKSILLLAFVAGTSLTFFAKATGNRTSAAATCTGSKNCHACKNCKYCKHCKKEGGTCGVCR